MNVVRKLVFVILIACSFGNANSQQFPFPAPGAKWNVLQSMAGSCTIKYEYTQDTVMCGYNYSMITIQNQSTCNWIAPLLIRSVGNLIYGRINSCSSSEILLYNFNLNVGDTFIAAANINDTAVVTSVTNVQMLDGSIRKHMILTSCCYPWQLYWIEGIGDMTTPYYCYNLLDPVLSLLCFEDSSALIYQNTLWNTCDSITNLNQIGEGVNHFDIYPNPAIAEIFINYEFNSGSDFSIIISDITGKLLRSYPIKLMSGKITISALDLPSGVLLCSLNQNGHLILTKKVIKQ